MAFENITDTERQGKGVSGLPNTPNLTPSELQAQFDSLGNLALDSLNKLIDKLNASTAASNIGTASGTVQADINTIKQTAVALAETVSKIQTAITAIEIEIGMNDGDSGESSSNFTELCNDVADISNSLIAINDTIIEIRAQTNAHFHFAHDVGVNTIDWLEDDTYDDFPYKAEVLCDYADEDYSATAVFDVEQATSGLFAPVVKTGIGTVTFYANAIPDFDFVVPVIKLVKECNIT